MPPDPPSLKVQKGESLQQEPPKIGILMFWVQRGDAAVEMRLADGEMILWHLQVLLSNRGNAEEHGLS